MTLDQSKPPRPENARTFLLLLLAGLVMSVLVMVLMAKVHEEISEPFLEHVDRSLLQNVHAHDTPALTCLAFTLTFIGSPGRLKN